MSLTGNNGETARIGGVTGKGFLPGQSGNPAGRPKGVARTVREVCGGDPSKLIDLEGTALKIRLGEHAKKLRAGKCTR